jgi:hypothetical protein
MWRDLENQVGVPTGTQPEAVPTVKEAVSGVTRRAPERRGWRQSTQATCVKANMHPGTWNFSELVLTAP